MRAKILIASFKKRFPPLPESGLVRGVLIAFGLGLMTLILWGGWGDYADGVGIAAFITGAIFLYLGYSGQKVVSLKAGDSELTLGADTVAYAMEDPDVPETVKEQIAEDLTSPGRKQDLPSRLKNAVANIEDAATFENEVGRALSRISLSEGWVVESQIGSRDLRYDFRVSRPKFGQAGTESVLVECKWVTKAVTPSHIREWEFRVKGSVSRSFGRGAILVVPSAVREERLGVVVWRDKLDDDRLQAALENAFIPENM